MAGGCNRLKNRIFSYFCLPFFKSISFFHGQRRAFQLVFYKPSDRRGSSKFPWEYLYNGLFINLEKETG